MSEQHYDREGYPLCPKYDQRVLPDENDLCSLCHEHSASVTYCDNDSREIRWMNLAQLGALKNIPV